jgi:ectoine hydroxylase-related dioxygenase (phytanoyl-CoA dioxygenase family)
MSIQSEIYLAQQKISDEEINSWVDTFHSQGYLFLENVLPPQWCKELRDDLDKALEEDRSNNEDGEERDKTWGYLQYAMFEKSKANLRLFDLEPIVSFAEALIAKNCHVIHNNSFKTLPGGGIMDWHQDDAPHFIVKDGPVPSNVHLPVLFFTANYYLTDVTSLENGATEVIPGSHLFGQAAQGNLEGTKWEDQIHSNLGKAGSVVLFNNQTWHRGGPNISDETRYITQITYGRRIIGHKYYPFMNYQMPEHIYKDASPRLKRLLGFLPHGTYG